MRSPPLHAPQRGAKGGGRLLTSPDISPYASALHAPRFTPQVPVGAQPLKDGRTHAPQTPKGLGCFNPLQPVKPPTLTSICQEHCWSSRGGMVCLGGWVGGGGGWAIPCSIPTNFLISFGSNALSQIHTPNLSTIQPLPPPSCFSLSFWLQL